MAEATTVKRRPKHLDLAKIRLPLPGFVSILHRVSGAGLFVFGLPLLLWIFGASLGTAEQVDQCRAVLANPLIKLFLLGLLWAYLHHFCAGIRFLFLDMHKGIELKTARITAGVVLAVSLGLTFAIGVFIW